MKFYLGTHLPGWLEQVDVPLFISRHRLAGRKRLPRARGPWALDSGGFMELSMHGRWTFGAQQYVEEVRRFHQEIGNLEWAAIQDHMVEPWILKKTGSTVLEHQERTVTSYLELRALAPEIPWAPVLQGWTPMDYLEHAEMYERSGVDLREAPVVGVGSICRRQNSIRAALLLRMLARETGLRLHGFGVKITGLRGMDDVLHSADSMAWSLNARKSQPLPECERHRHCTSCLPYALEWREHLLRKLEREAA